MSAELVPIDQTPGGEWREFIFDPEVMPQSFGTGFTTVLEKTQVAWEARDNPPTSSLTSAIFELAINKELEVNGHIIKRGPNAPQ